MTGGPPATASTASMWARGAWSWDVRTRLFRADASFAALLGLDPQEAADGMPTTRFFDAVVAEDLPRVKIAVAAIMRGAESFAKTYRVRDAKGVVRWVSARGRGESDTMGKVVRFHGELIDITDLRRVEQQLRVAQSAGGVGTFEHVDGFATADVSDQFCRLLGLHPADALPLRTINALVRSGDPAIIRSADPVSTSGLGYSELRIKRADTGEERWIARRGEHRADGVGAGPRFIGVIYDITEAKRTEQKLEELSQTLEARVQERTRERDRVWNCSLDLIAVLGRDGVLRSVNPAWLTLTQKAEGGLVGRSILDFVHIEDRTAATQALASAVGHVDLRLADGSGAWRWVNFTFVPDDSETLYATGRDVNERRQLEEQLRQSQKMETVGQLTGGIAHDFNNMLTGIIGGLELARRRLEVGRQNDAYQFMDAVVVSAQRAAALTHRLLAFSRRQTLDPRSVDVSELVRSIEDLLRRTLGERINLSVVSSPSLWAARCDVNQLESALLNLAINARDAMPDGGTLTIESVNLSVQRRLESNLEPIEPGEYVVVDVSDTGIGMSESVKAKVFEPFFTTKPIGKGTGLGLPMVYGFVRQSGGHVAISSEEGLGATVRLYLPRFVDPEDTTDTVKLPEPAIRAGGERVLVVEDDPQVKMMLAAVLTDIGYQVSEAVDANAALKFLKAGNAFHLLITDVGLPGMNGRQLAELARQYDPALPVLFVTGYVANAADRSGFLEAGMHMISKPFTLQTLATAVREAIQA